MKYLSKHRMYHIWYQMIARCTIPNNVNYRKYGARGITVWEQWLPPKEKGFVQFLEDMVYSRPDLFIGDEYSQDYFPSGISLDREKGAGGYNPENCRWTSYEIQNLNKASTVRGRIYPQGVQWREAKQKFNAYYMEGTKNKSLGTHATLFEAVCARKSWEMGRFKLLQQKLDEHIREVEMGLNPTEIEDWVELKLAA